MVAHIEMKLGTYAYYIISMTITCFRDDHILFERSLRQFSLTPLLQSSNLLIVAHMEMKLGTSVCNIVSMTTTTTNSVRHFSLKLLLHSSSLLFVALMEVKLGAHVYYIVSMTTTTTNSLRHFSLKWLLHSSNLLTAAHMGMNAYHFHDDNRPLFSIINFYRGLPPSTEISIG